MAQSTLVYSSKTGSHKKSEEKESTWQTGSGNMKMRLETAGRGGKAVTVLFNLSFSEEEAKQMLKAMQSAFGCGGALKDSTIELRGDVRGKVEDFFTKKNLKIVRAGG